MNEVGIQRKLRYNVELGHRTRNIRDNVPFVNLGYGRSKVLSYNDKPTKPSVRPKRADAQRNQQTLLDAAASLFITSGVEVPIRDIAAQAGVGTATIYRHFPTRADLIVAVYRHQVEACAKAGPELLATSSSPYAALERWMDLFVDFLVTKHGLAAAMQSDKPSFATLHVSFLDRLLPVCEKIITAAVEAGEIHVRAWTLLN